MFNKRTVFVLGADASAEFKFPQGLSLAKQIQKKLDVAIQRGSLAGAGDHALYDKMRRSGKFQRNELSETFRAIRNGITLSNSIDDFLDLHQGNELLRLVGKAAIIKSIVEAEANSLLMPKNGDSEFDVTKVEDTWLVKLMRMMGTRTSADKIFENVVFVSFNYDRTLEHFLAQAIQALYDMSDEEAKPIVREARIFHPYGIVAPLGNATGQLPFGGFGKEYGSTALNFTDNIRTYTEEIADPKQIDHIRIQLRAADQIVFLGFAFHQQNVKMLEASLERTQIYATTFEESGPNTIIFEERLLQIFSANARVQARRGFQFLNATANSFIDAHRLALTA